MHWFALKGTVAAIVALTTTLIGPIADFVPATPPGGPAPNGLIRQAHRALVDRPSLGQPCLVGTPNCLSLDQKPPAPCLVSTQRCEADGRVINLVDGQTIGYKR
jgi:hypothetical protein